MVEEHGLPVAKLEAALEEGRPKHYQNLLKNVNAGYLTSEPGARKMVEEHGLPVAKLEAALETGRAVRL